MGRGKKYSGYKAYDYLAPGIDYKEFKFREVDQVSISEALKGMVIPCSALKGGGRAG